MFYASSKRPTDLFAEDTAKPACIFLLGAYRSQLGGAARRATSSSFVPAGSSKKIAG